VREVRVIGADAEQLGVMPPEEALEKAREVGLDLVEVAANSTPPVCRIMDYGRYKYEQKKKRAGKNKQAHAAALKEVKLRPGTDLHDLEFKLNNARRFLMEGDKVKVTVMFRGREMVHTYRGRKQLEQVMQQLKPIAKLENPPRMEGRFMSMILVADREAVAEVRRAEEEEAKREAQEAEQAEAKRAEEESQIREQERLAQETARKAEEAQRAKEKEQEEEKEEDKEREQQASDVLAAEAASASKPAPTRKKAAARKSPAAKKTATAKKTAVKKTTAKKSGSAKKPATAKKSTSAKKK
jgi:translation initiation factor IF-3